VVFYNQRGTAEQHIKEGKNALKWTRLSCRSFKANAVRLQLHALAYNLANFMRTLALPVAVEHWSLRRVPDGRGGGSEEPVPANLAADRQASSATDACLRECDANESEIEAGGLRHVRWKICPDAVRSRTDHHSRWQPIVRSSNFVAWRDSACQI
jgi:hypothetical protein